MRNPYSKIQNLFKKLSTKGWIVFFVLSLPILIFCLGLLLTGNKLAPGDGDYLMQAHEAMRISILHFHQFPWWNPWIAGGVPLFANPQFGLFSIITPFVLIFGTIMGFKLAIFAYFLIGFWGFRQLFIKGLKTPVLTATLLSYVWTFGTFLTYRSEGGHYTFLTIQYFPWAFYFYLRRDKDKYAWLKLGAILGLMALSAAHNITVMSYAIIALIIIFDVIRLSFKKRAPEIKNLLKKETYFWIKTGLVFVLLTGYRLYYTLQYLHEYPRPEGGMEPTIGIPKALFAMFGPFRQFMHTPKIPQWTWLEVSAYIGFATMIAAILVVIAWAIDFKKRKKLFSYSPYVLAIIWVICFLLGLADITGKYSPYSILHFLPIFSSMRVATRWLVWSSVITLIFIAIYRGSRFRLAINILLAISVVELFFLSRPNLSATYKVSDVQYRPSSSAFEQKALWDTKRSGIPYDENFTDATDNNYGQIIAGDSLIDTRWPAPAGVTTHRCPIDNGCNLVSSNASLTYWSPNKLVITRKTSGPITLDMNPGKYWEVNGVYIFPYLKVTDPSANFIITNPSKTLVVQYVPKYSVEWWFSKI